MRRNKKPLKIFKDTEFEWDDIFGGSAYLSDLFGEESKEPNKRFILEVTNDNGEKLKITFNLHMEVILVEDRVTDHWVFKSLDFGSFDDTVIKVYND
jgi:hypothetical protein